MKQILIPISGGLDSTYVLYKYLTETNYMIYAHHIELYDKYQFRIDQENKASKDVVSWLKKNTRDFRYSQSSYINPFGGSDITLVLFTMSQICYWLLGPETDEIVVATGRVVEDDERGPIHTQDDVFFAGIKNIDVPITLERPIRHMTKQEVINKMPKELVNLTWSCRTPIFINGVATPCGECHACKERLNAENGAKNGEKINV